MYPSPTHSGEKGRGRRAATALRRRAPIHSCPTSVDDLDVTRVHVHVHARPDVRDKHARLAHVFFRAPSASARRGYVRATRKTTRKTTRRAPSLARGIDDDVGATDGFGWVRRRATTGDATRLDSRGRKRMWKILNRRTTTPNDRSSDDASTVDVVVVADANAASSALIRGVGVSGWDVEYGD